MLARSVVLLSVAVASVQGSCGHLTSFVATTLPTFNYSPTTGPLLWHLMNPAWATCGTGTIQAPTALTSTNSTTSGLELAVATSAQGPVIFENLGTTVEVIPTGNLTVGATSYALKQCEPVGHCCVDPSNPDPVFQVHFHTPSEHLLNGQISDLEMHMVFQNRN